MDQPGQPFGALNPKAPPALSRFAFLIGAFRCEARIKMDNGRWETFQAAWLGRYVLEGYAIADEYRMMNAAGDLLVLGINLRTYEPSRHTWNIRWLNALTGAWTDLSSPEFGGVRFDGPSVTYAFPEPTASHAYTRATYTSFSDSHFTWRGDKSSDAKNWTEFMVVDCYRTAG